MLSFSFEFLGAVFALVDYCLKKIDKEFSLSEKERLIMDYSDYHASFLVAVLIAHYGGRGNRSKWMAASAFILGIASIIFALIFYKYEIIKPVEKSEGENFSNNLLYTKSIWKSFVQGI